MIFFWKHVVRYQIFHMSFDKNLDLLMNQKVDPSLTGIYIVPRTVFSVNRECDKPLLAVISHLHKLIIRAPDP